METSEQNKLTKNIKFYKEQSGRWYADIPEWQGDKSDLEMVMGADTFLDLVSEGSAIVNVILTDIPEESNRLYLIEIGSFEGVKLEEGAEYRLNIYNGQYFGIKMWLCDVTKYVFGYFPEIIWFNVLA